MNNFWEVKYTCHVQKKRERMVKRIKSPIAQLPTYFSFNSLNQGCYSLIPNAGMLFPIPMRFSLFLIYLFSF